jgi:hypothetical protein
MKITINVAPSNIRIIKNTLKRLEIPESKLLPGLWRILNQSRNFSSRAWIGEHVYPDRTTAERIANIYLRDDGCRVELAFWEERKEVREFFYPRWVAKMLRNGRPLEYSVSKIPGESAWRFVDKLAVAA